MSEIIEDIHEEALASAESEYEGNLYDFVEMQHRFGSPDSLSTGFPNWDLLLFENKETGKWGWPYGRTVGLFGEQSALKTTTCYRTLVQNIKHGGKHLGKENGGISLLLTKESDYDLNYLYKFMKKAGITKAKFDEIKDNFKVAPISNIVDIAKICINYLKRWNDYALKLEKRGERPHEKIPRITIGVDSIGATPASVNQERAEDDFEDGDQRGVKAKEIHRLFQNVTVKLGRIGAMLMYINHYRDKQQGRTKFKEAHKSSLKYYTSCTVELSRGYKRTLQQDRSHNNVSYQKGWPLEIEVDKLRQATPLDGKTQINYYENVGLDLTDAIFRAGKMSGVIVEYGGTYQIDYDEDENEVLAEKSGSYSKKEMRGMIADSFKFRKALEKQIYKEGPLKPQEDKKDNEQVVTR